MRRWRRLLFPGVLALAVYVGVEGGEYSLPEARRAGTDLARMRAEIRVARQRNDSLGARIDSLRHHDEALERLARERYGFIRDGEYLYRISRSRDAEETVEPTEQAGQAGTSILGLLRGRLRPGR